MSKYNGLLVRQNLQDTGSIPRAGAWTACPDLIPYGIQPVESPVEFFSSNYDQNVGKKVITTNPNYIYVRTKNITDTPMSGDVRLFYAKQSLFLYPNQWLTNTVKTEQTKSDVSVLSNVLPGGVGVTEDPFLWMPTDVTEHHCLITLVSTTEHPFDSQKPDPNITSIQELAAWIGKTGGSGWHNVHFTTAGAPTFTNSTPYPGSSTPGEVVFTITAENAPIGSQVSFYADKPLPSGERIVLEATTVNDDQQFMVGKKYSIPANWSANFYYSYFENGHGKLPGFKVSMSALAYSDGSDAIAEYARPISELFLNPLLHDSASGKLLDMPVHKVIPVGSDLTKVLEEED